MLDAGITDSAKVTRLAFENAVSIAGTIATVEAGVTEGNKAQGGQHE